MNIVEERLNEGSFVRIAEVFGTNLGQVKNINSMIKKTDKGYEVLSEKTGKSFGTYKSLRGANHRLGQIEYFKMMEKINKIND